MNLNNEIDRLINKLEELLKNSNWKRRDTYYFEYKPNSKSGVTKNFNLPEAYISFSPEILYYQKKSENIAEIWLKSYEFDLTEESEDELFNIVKPFRDQDYRGNKFWINPDYPNGYWCNHTL